ncbi:MAG: phospho-sugar mutase [Nocardioidaceae bacterium]
MSGPPSALHDRVNAWLADDPDAAAAAELRGLLDRAGHDDAALQELEDRFSRELEFGTAGLRGEMAAGPNRMNRAVVIRAAAGLAAYLSTSAAPVLDGLSDGRAERRGPAVVVGYDARHLSHEFACDTADVMHGAGLRCATLPRPLPTPVLAYAIRKLGCAAGVMVTASHNPPRDNGYKVYLGDGSQIVPPADAEISGRITAAPRVPDVPRVAGWELLDEDIVDQYVADVAALMTPGGARDLTMSYTPLHGVGDEIVERVLNRAGFPAPVPVSEQVRPDADFPTVTFPNPEEPGAMDLALALAERRGADIVVANDPDADRCAVAVPDGDRWRMLRGDEVGVLLADHLLRRGVRGVYATTIVSSSLLGVMAARHGTAYVETLTGFKWIGRVPGLAYGYEEALGYCVAPELVRDKDGVSALLRIAELAAELRADGRTLLDRLDDIAIEYGVYATDQLSVRVDDVSVIGAAMQRLRQHPPVELGGFAVEVVDDLSRGSQGLPATEGMRFRLVHGGRIVVRPSGTEPKLKCYLEIVVPVVEGEVGPARAEGTARLNAVRTAVAAALQL